MDDFYDIIEERYLSDNEDNDDSIIDLTHNDNSEIDTSQTKV
jgi:hypothetical protein